MSFTISHPSVGRYVAIIALAALTTAGPLTAAPAKTALPVNLALKAKVAASSAHSAPHGAHLACDGRIAVPISKADAGKSWAAQGNKHPGGVWFTLEWPRAVTVAEVVYYGRTGWVWNENWKKYEVYLGDETKPAAKGKFKSGHGPQRIKLARPASVSRLRLKFLSSYGGPNPGATEIQVYPASPPDKLLGKFIKPPAGGVYDAPPIPEIRQSPELAARLKSGDLGFTRMLVIKRHHVRCSHVYTYHCEGQRDGGGLFIHDVTDGNLTKLVDAADGQILGCDLSYDGKTILFSWRRSPSKFYQVYRINVDGTGLKQLTEGNYFNYDCCWLPDGGIVFLSSRRPQAAYCFFTPVGILYRMDADGSNQVQISANYLNDFTPAVLNDGRIIYGRWEYVDRPAIPIQGLWTMNADGTMLQGYFGNRVLDPASFIEPQPIPGTTAILCTLTGHNGSCRGAIGIIDRTRGDNAQESIRNVTPEVRLRGVRVSSNGPRGPYQTPYPIDRRHYLVSYDGVILLRDYDCTEQVTVMPRPEGGMGYFNPKPIRPRPRPNQKPDGPEKPLITGPWAALYLQDVYIGLEPEVKRGEVKQICVVQELARSLIDSRGVRRPAFGFQRVLVSCGATYVPKKVLGYAKVHDDGSAYFKVPALTPIYFMAIDAEGRAIQRMRSFTHLMPGEVQGCVGCHEPRLERSRPVRPKAMAGQIQDLDPPGWGVMGFSYAQIVQPVLDRHCSECHNARKRPKGIDLSGDRTDYFNVSYDVLARSNQGREGSPYISWIPTYNGHEANIFKIAPRTWGSPASKLAKIVMSGHPDDKGKPRVKMPAADQHRLLAWMDLNVPYYGTADTALPDNRACRQIFPTGLRRVMDDVYTRRCDACHQAKSVSMKRAAWRTRGGINDPYLRITNPHLNAFLLAPLAKGAGGTEQCSKVVFADTSDPDYKAVLKTFEPTDKAIKAVPRMDMPGGKPAACCNIGK